MRVAEPSSPYDDDEPTIALTRAPQEPGVDGETPADDDLEATRGPALATGDEFLAYTATEDHTLEVTAAPEVRVVSGRPVSPTPAISRSRPLPGRQPRRRRGIAPPPVPGGFAPPARQGAGAGAVQVYPPRMVPDAPPASPEPSAAAAPRAVSARSSAEDTRSRVLTTRVVMAIAAACAIGGATWLGFIFLG